MASTDGGVNRDEVEVKLFCDRPDYSLRLVIAKLWQRPRLFRDEYINYSHTSTKHQGSLTMTRSNMHRAVAFLTLKCQSSNSRKVVMVRSAQVPQSRLQRAWAAFLASQKLPREVMSAVIFPKLLFSL